MERAPREDDPGTYNQIWFDPGTRIVGDRRTSLIVSPPDGRIPYTPEMRERQRAQGEHRVRGPRDSWVDVDTGERCMTDGVPMLWLGYNPNHHIVQTPDHVVILHEMYSDRRIIPLDGRPHGDVRQWNGDIRGRWEGDTLVVETTNLVDKTIDYRWQEAWRMPTETMRVVERSPEPGGEVVLGGPAARVGADLGDELEGTVGREAIDLREVDAGQVVQHGPDVEVWFIAASARAARAGQRRGGRRDGGRQLLEFGVDGPVAGEELRLAHVKEFEVLPQDKEVLGAVVPGQRGDDLVRGGPAVRVAVAGQDVRVPLARDEGAQDRQAGLADNVADHAREQEVHLGERLLHPLDIGAGGLDEDVAVPYEGAEGEDRPGGAEAPAQEADAVEFAQPLTVLDVALAAGDVFDVAGVDEQDLQAPGFEDVVDRDPVDPGRFHGDAGDATGDEPVGEPLEVGGEGPEGSDGGGVPIGRDGHIVLGGATVDAGDIDLDAFEHGRGATRRVGGPAAIVLHGMLLHTARGIRDQGGGVESILLNGITREGVSPVIKPQLPGPRYDTGLRVAPVGRSASGPGCSADSTIRHVPPPARAPRQFLA